MSRTNRKNGFATVEALLVVIILIMIGFIGWYVWHTKQSTDKTFSDTSKSAPAAKAAGQVSNFAECEKAKGSIIQQTFPEKCVTPDGKTFTDTSNTNPGSSTTVAKAAADSPTPAAGTCATSDGSVVTVTLAEGVPEPRCSQVTASQTLKVVNPTSQKVTVTLGAQTVDIPAGQSGTISIPFGEYLETGDHVMKTAPALYGGSGPEIYLPAS